MMSTKKSWWRRYLDFPLIWKLAIALLAGLIVGPIWGEDATVLEPFGEIFLRLVNMLIIPLIVATLIVGITSATPQKLGRIGGKFLSTICCRPALLFPLVWGWFCSCIRGVAYRPRRTRLKRVRKPHS
ncbi:hypothetical protein BSZ39_08210 [Bowdeniella nasicola]|uniref:Sodium:dicarboxylate symporter family protein n=1 Tax=Bowdeniella nasicola TaxID=208480 RepID=A0A1Q5Q1M4_9ACTO|nr:hypothetical protein BSZ39_08210 [Bowdeniella nasicola]